MGGSLIAPLAVRQAPTVCQLTTWWWHHHRRPTCRLTGKSMLGTFELLSMSQNEA